MKKEKAKGLLRNQLEKLKSSRNRNDTWVFHTASIIEEIFGKESAEYNYIGKFRFGTWSHNYESNEAIHWRLEEQERKIKQFLENCVESVDAKGVYRKPQSNPVSNWSSSEFWTAISGLIVAAISIGFYFGNLSSSFKIDRMEFQIKEMKDSLSLHIPALPNPQPIPQTKPEPEIKKYSKKK